jgi:flagellar assembly factor FliW
MQEQSFTVEFPRGIPGFEEFSHFAMSFEENSPMAQLTACDDDEHGFLLLQPQQFFGEFVPQVDLDPESVSVLDLKDGENVDMWVIVTLGDDLQNSTANLRAPLLINMRSQKGVQMIIDNDTFKAKQPLFQ